MSGEASSFLTSFARPNPHVAARYASQHEGGSEENEGMFSSVLSRYTDNDDEEAPHRRPIQSEEVEEAAMAHDQIYSQNSGQPAEESSSRDLGSAAALQAFKMFSGGGGGGASGGGSNELVGVAMGEAMKLFNAQGGKADKTEMLQSAAVMAMKLYAQHESSQSSGQSGGGGGGGIGSLLSLLGNSGSGSGGMAASLLSKFL
ncbi:hypothetical protein BDF14DRAFT_1766733 [Spinellus fusiger]|nr:hypothetical protein BDF14DRAFT_1766733 [Spinellus fusiger]